MREAVRFLWPYIRKYRRGLVLGICALVCRNLAAVSVPLVIREAVNSLTSSFEVDAVVRFALLLIGLTAVKGVFQYWMRVVIIGISRDIEFDLRNDLFANLMRLSTGFYARFRTGDVMARATNDLNSVRMMLGPGIMYTADTVLTGVLAIAVMGWFDWRLTMVALLPAPIVSLLVVVFGRYIHARFKEIQKLFADISSRVQENIAGVRVIRAYVQEQAEERVFADLNRDYIGQNLRLARASGLFMPSLQSLTSISFLPVLWYGGYRLLDGGITLGGFLMFNVFLGYLIWPMIAMGWVANMMHRGTASLGRVKELLNQEPEIVDPPAPAVLTEPVRGEVEFRDVGVRFGELQALQNIQLRVEAGSTVAVVGHTGSGKSTLVQLVPRLLDPTSGRVFLDGMDLRRMSLRDLRSRIGFVPQETFLFSATLAENIAFGVKEASEEQIHRAAEQAGLAGDVAEFPKGYDTMLGERGITLSGGQKQRAAIARAILRDPSILILDDALSSVDTVTEERILTALSDLMRERTTILISHRVSTVQHADRIYVIEDGSVAEDGSHRELLAQGRYYADLYQRQMLEDELEAI
ncbi:MAG: ABC transporter ATP-binding protein [bacterium]|nr:ABC transporter ATP-binding protein [bacterium]